MAKSPIEKTLVFKGFEEIEAGIVRWSYVSYKNKSSDRKKLVELAVKILDRLEKI